MTEQAIKDAFAQPVPDKAAELSQPCEIARTVDPLPYPLDALPDGVRAAVQSVIETGQMPVGIAASSAVAALSLSGQHLANVARDQNLIGPCSLNVLSIAISGERKTACDRAMSSDIRRWADEKNRSMEDMVTERNADIAAWRQKKAGIESAIKKVAGAGKPAKDSLSMGELEAELKKLLKDEPQEVVLPRLFHEDATPEGLAWEIAVGWPSQSVWSDEGGIVLGGHGMKPDSVLAFFGLLNRLWDGNPFHPTRKIAKTREIRGKRVTCNMMVQPDLLMELLQKTLARGLGFLARYLVAWPDSTMGTRLYREPILADNRVSAFGDRLKQLLDVDPVLNEQGDLSPPTIHLSREAKQAWIAFHDEVEIELSPKGELFDVRDFASKVAENAARVACLFHLFEQGPSGNIKPTTMQSAIQIVTWHLHEAMRVFSELAEPEHIANARKLSDWLRHGAAGRLKGGTVPLVDVLRYGPNAVRTKKVRDEALQLLADPNIRHVSLVPANAPTKIEVHPQLLREGIK